MQHNFIWGLRRICGVALAPVVANSVGKYVTASVKAGTGNSTPDRWIALEAMFSIFVPEMESTITAGSAESAMNWVEGNCIDGIDVVDVAIILRRLTMALKAEIGARVLIFDVLDGATTLDTAYRKACSIRKAADYPRLPLERGLQCLIELSRIIEVDNVDVPVGGTDD